MKKILPIAMLALATMAVSCSSDDDNGPKNPTKDAISFSNPYVVNSVMARASANIDFKEFNVWGFVNTPDSYIFDKNTVSQSGTSWTVDKTEYWYMGQTYYFTGIAPVSSDITFTPVTTADPNNNYPGGGEIQFNSQTNNGETDIVYAFSGAIKHDSQESVKPVPLTFKHLLSRIMFSFTNNVSEATKLEITNLKLASASSEGTVNMNTEAPAWTSTGSFDITGINVDGQFGIGKKGISESRFVIPTTADKAYQISFTVNVYNGKQKVATYNHNVTLPGVTFEMGNSYSFNATFTQANLNPSGELSRIEFTVEDVVDWTENNTDYEL